jgi:hypothetical protein
LSFAQGGQDPRVHEDTVPREEWRREKAGMNSQGCPRWVKIMLFSLAVA